jgi:predicted permease
VIFDIIHITAPVFIIIGVGYLSVRREVVSLKATDGILGFAVKIAIPCLLFRATSSIDLQAAFAWRMLAAYYISAIGCFVIAILLLRKVFHKRPGEAVAIAFGALFSNLVMLGLPLSERAWGVQSMGSNIALIAVNAPICYLMGITVMEISRADGRDARETARIVLKTMFSNSIMIGIGLGLLVNISGLVLPDTISSSIELLASAALPVALFALGGVLTRYSMRESRYEAGLISGLSLIIQPLFTLALCQLLDLDHATTRSVVLMSAVAPGLNAYLFSTMYRRGEAAAASSVLMATILSIFSVTIWLLILG